MWWRCAERYVDLIRLILDTRNDPGGPTGLQVFSDIGKTVYGLQKLLGSMARRRAIDKDPHSFDFLDMPMLDGNSMGMPNVLGFGPELDEWL